MSDIRVLVRFASDSSQWVVDVPALPREGEEVKVEGVIDGERQLLAHGLVRHVRHIAAAEITSRLPGAEKWAKRRASVVSYEIEA